MHRSVCVISVLRITQVRSAAEKGHVSSEFSHLILLYNRLLPKRIPADECTRVRKLRCHLVHGRN